MAVKAEERILLEAPLQVHTAGGLLNSETSQNLVVKFTTADNFTIKVNKKKYNKLKGRALVVSPVHPQHFFTAGSRVITQGVRVGTIEGYGRHMNEVKIRLSADDAHSVHVPYKDVDAVDAAAAVGPFAFFLSFLNGSHVVTLTFQAPTFAIMLQWVFVLSRCLLHALPRPLSGFEEAIPEDVPSTSSIGSNDDADSHHSNTNSDSRVSPPDSQGALRLRRDSGGDISLASMPTLDATDLLQLDKQHRADIDSQMSLYRSFVHEQNSPVDMAAHLAQHGAQVSATMLWVQRRRLVLSRMASSQFASHVAWDSKKVDGMSLDGQLRLLATHMCDRTWATKHGCLPLVKLNPDGSITTSHPNPLGTFV